MLDMFTNVKYFSSLGQTEPVEAPLFLEECKQSTLGLNADVRAAVNAYRVNTLWHSSLRRHTRVARVPSQLTVKHGTPSFEDSEILNKCHMLKLDTIVTGRVINLLTSIWTVLAVLATVKSLVFWDCHFLAKFSSPPSSDTPFSTDGPRERSLAVNPVI